MTVSSPAPPRQGAKYARRVSVRPRGMPLSVRVSLRTTVIGGLAAILAVAVAVWAMSLGDSRIPPADVLGAVLGIGDVASGDAFIVRSLRLPRALTAALAGAALAASGAIFQGLVRNPLVAPDVIGVDAGAAVVAVSLIVVTGASSLLSVGAFTGAVVASFLIYAFTWRKGISGNRLVLVGIGVDALLTAFISLMIVRFPIEQVSSAVLWRTGTFYLSGWSDVTMLVVGLAVLLPAGMWLTRHLGVLQLGDDVARGLGVRAEPARAALLLVGAALAAVAVAASGPIAFVALITPHIARMLAGPLTGGVLALSAVLGAVVLGIADLIAQHAFGDLSLPAGVVTAAVGAPYFLLLLYRANKLL